MNSFVAIKTDYGFDVGDTVDITYKGAVVDKISGENVSVTITTGEKRHMSLRKVSVTLVKKAVKTPKHWPPQTGDVWRTGDMEYHILGRSPAVYSGETMDYISGGVTTLQKFPSLELVYRKGNSL